MKSGDIFINEILRDSHDGYFNISIANSYAI